MLSWASSVPSLISLAVISFCQSRMTETASLFSYLNLSHAIYDAVLVTVTEVVELTGV